MDETQQKKEAPPKAEPARPAQRPALPSPRRYSQDEMLAMAAGVLTAAKVRFTRNDKRRFIEFTTELKNCKAMGPVRVMVIPNKDSALLSYAVCPIRAEKAVRGEVCEYLMRANQNLGVGCFEMDFDTGEIRYKTYLLMQGPLPPRIVILRYIVVTHLMLDRFGDGLLRVLFGVDKAADAITPPRLN